MVRLKSIRTAFLAFGLALIFSSCDPDDDNTCCDPSNPECENYDPCYGKSETTAFFTIAQQYFPVGDNSDIYIEDDIVTGGKLKFTAIPQEGATYTWILGVDTIVGNYEVTRTLGDLPEGRYSNSLIVTKQADTLCFPDDVGMDFSSRIFTRIESCQAAILGKYRGVFLKDSPDSVDIELALSPSLSEIEPCESTSIVGAVFLVNYSLNGDTIKLNTDGAVNSRISFTSLNEIGIPEGEIIYDSSINLVTASYSIDDEEFHFTGRKL